MATKPKPDAGWYCAEGGKVMHWFTPWEANDYFMYPLCGLLDPVFSKWLRLRPERKCQHCTKKRDHDGQEPK